MNQILLVPMITGLIFVITGLIFQKFPPKKINGLVGYRTKKSMKSQESWDFAQVYSSQQTVKIGSILTMTSFSGLFFPFEDPIKGAVELGLTFAVLFLLISSTEKELKSKFGEN